MTINKHMQMLIESKVHVSITCLSTVLHVFLGEILAERARVDVGPSIFDYCHVMQLKNAGKFNRAMESTGGA